MQRDDFVCSSVYILGSFKRKKELIMAKYRLRIMTFGQSFLGKLYYVKNQVSHPEEVGRFFAKIKDRRERVMFKLMYDFGLRVLGLGKLTLRV